jgi:hypothetical protein
MRSASTATAVVVTAGAEPITGTVAGNAAGAPPEPMLKPEPPPELPSRSQAGALPGTPRFPARSRPFTAVATPPPSGAAPRRPCPWPHGLCPPRRRKAATRPWKHPWPALYRAPTTCGPATAPHPPKPQF